MLPCCSIYRYTDRFHSVDRYNVLAFKYITDSIVSLGKSGEYQTGLAVTILAVELANKAYVDCRLNM